MTYREMRNFTEMMKSLGYNRLISMENFRSPNFTLTAEILQWLVRRFDQNADVGQNIDTEQDRVIFIKMVAHFLMTKAHIKLNTRRLYQADGYAVRELAKVAYVLYGAMRHGDRDTGGVSVQDVLDQNKLKEIKETRLLASQIITCGATLSDLLHREVELRESRAVSLGNQLEMADVEQAIQCSISGVDVEKQRQQLALGNIASDEANLDTKIEKKRSELDRNHKRLSTLQSVRPAYMDEYEQLEGELNHLYSEYLNLFRNQAFLESQYEDMIRQQLDRSDDKEMTLKKMADQLRKAESVVSAQFNGKSSVKNKKDEFANLLDDNDDDDDDDVDESSEDDDLNRQGIELQTGVNKSHIRGGPSAVGDIKNGKKPATVGAQRNFGNMGDNFDNEDEESDDDDDEDEDEDEDDENDSEEIDENSDVSDNQFGKEKRMNATDDNYYNRAAGAGFSRPRGAEHNSKASKTRTRVPSEPDDDF